MSRLKAENLKKCVSLLREFIDDASKEDNKKEIAILALNQLQRITAGSDPNGGGGSTMGGPECFSRPRADP
jgi:hypothetical protein